MFWSLTRRSILGSDCIDSYFDALSALWVLPDCSLSALWVFTECSLSAHWVLTYFWLIAWKSGARMMKIDCSRQTWHERTNRRTNKRRLAFLGLLSEPKMIIYHTPTLTPVRHLAPFLVQTVRPAPTLHTSSAPGQVSVFILTWSVTAILNVWRGKTRIYQTRNVMKN